MLRYASSKVAWTGRNRRIARAWRTISCGAIEDECVQDSDAPWKQRTAVLMRAGS
jgi:hypothetical protein